MNFGLGEFYAISCALMWAAAVVLFKKSGESLGPVPLNLFKNLLGVVLMFLTVLVFSPAWPGLPWDVLAITLLSGFIGITLGDTLYFRALNEIGASRMGIAQTVYSPSVILLSAVYLGERLGALQWLGVALVLSGIFLVNFNPRLTDVDAARLKRGLLDAAGSVFLMALGVVMVKPILERYDFLWVVMLRIVAGTVGLYAFMASWRKVKDVYASFSRVRHWPAVLAGSALGTYFSMMAWLAGYKYTDASVASVLNEMAAVFILAFAAIFLKERLHPRQLAGSALAITGVVFVVV